MTSISWTAQMKIAGLREREPTRVVGGIGAVGMPT